MTSDLAVSAATAADGSKPGSFRFDHLKYLFRSLSNPKVVAQIESTLAKQIDRTETFDERAAWGPTTTWFPYTMEVRIIGNDTPNTIRVILQRLQGEQIEGLTRDDESKLQGRKLVLIDWKNNLVSEPKVFTFGEGEKIGGGDNVRQGVIDFNLSECSTEFANVSEPVGRAVREDISMHGRRNINPDTRFALSIVEVREKKL